MQQLSATLSVTVGELGYATSQASQLTNLASQRDTLAVRDTFFSTTAFQGDSPLHQNVLPPSAMEVPGFHVSARSTHPSFEVM